MKTIIDPKTTLAKLMCTSFEPTPVKKMFQVWREGYVISGNSSDATYCGECMAYTFLEACEILCCDTIDRNSDGSIRVRDGYASDWACRFFDNEIDARKSFG